MTRGDYDALRDYLAAQDRTEVMLSVEAIEELLGFALPRASHRASWWDTARAPDEKMPQREACLAAGYAAKRAPDGLSIVFTKLGTRRRWK